VCARFAGLETYGFRSLETVSRFAAHSRSLLPFGRFGDYFESTAKIASSRLHHKSEHVTAALTPEAVPNAALRINVERWVPLTMQWAKANELATASAQPRELAGDRGQVSTRFHFAGVEASRGSREHAH
jgi:hypothetical protein